VRQSLRESYERWDGKGAADAKGEQIRLVYLADVVAVYHRHGGLEAAVAVAKERSGTAFDPSLVDLFCSQAEVLLSDLDSASGWKMVIAAEPQLELLVSEEWLGGRRRWAEALAQDAMLNQHLDRRLVGLGWWCPGVAGRLGRRPGLRNSTDTTERDAGMLRSRPGRSHRWSRTIAVVLRLA
jgi:hypothetical protein